MFYDKDLNNTHTHISGHSHLVHQLVSRSVRQTTMCLYIRLGLVQSTTSRMAQYLWLCLEFSSISSSDPMKWNDDFLTYKTDRSTDWLAEWLHDWVSDNLWSGVSSLRGQGISIRVWMDGWMDSNVKDRCILNKIYILYPRREETTNDVVTSVGSHRVIQCTPPCHGLKSWVQWTPFTHLATATIILMGWIWSFRHSCIYDVVGVV